MRRLPRRRCNDIAGAMKADSAQGGAVSRSRQAGAPKPAAPRRRAATADGDAHLCLAAGRRIAAQKGVDLAAHAGTGPRGRIVKSDVESAKPGAAKPAGAACTLPPPAPAFRVWRRLPDARLFYPGRQL